MGFLFSMEPNAQQLTPLPNPIGGAGDYFLRCMIDPRVYQDMTVGKTKTVVFDNFAVRCEINNFILAFQYVAVLRNQDGNFVVDTYLHPVNRGQMHLSATVKVSNLMRSRYNSKYCQKFSKKFHHQKFFKEA